MPPLHPALASLVRRVSIVSFGPEVHALPLLPSQAGGTPAQPPILDSSAIVFAVRRSLDFFFLSLIWSGATREPAVALGVGRGYAATSRLPAGHQDVDDPGDPHWA